MIFIQTCSLAHLVRLVGGGISLIICLLLGVLLGGLLLLLLIVGSLLGRLGRCELVKALRLLVLVLLVLGLVRILRVGIIISRHRGRVRVGAIGGFVVAHVVVDGVPDVVVMGLGAGVLSENNVETTDGSSNGCGHPA
jgi:hypothetical protein